MDNQKMNLKTLKLLIISSLLLSGNAFAQGSAPIDQLLSCSGWNERATKNKSFFLEDIMMEGYETDNKKYKMDLKEFNKLYIKKVDPDAEEWDNTTRYVPRNKTIAPFEDIIFYGYSGAGFRYEAKLKPTVNIDKFKANLEKRDNFKFYNYSENQIKKFITGRNFASSSSNSESEFKKIYKQYPWISVTNVELENQKNISIFGKKIINNPTYSSYIAIEQTKGKNSAYYLVCGVGQS